MARLLPLLMLSLVVFARVANAGVELNQSQVACDLEQVRAGTVATINVLVKNSGDKAAAETDVRIRLPENGFLVRMDDVPQLNWNDEERVVSLVVDLPAGAEYRFSFDLMPSRSEVGHHLTTQIEVVYLLDQVRWNAESSLRIMNAPSTAGIVIGGLRFHPAAFWILGWMVCSGLLFVWLRARLQLFKEHAKANHLSSDVRKVRAFPLSLLLMAPMALLMVLGGMVWEDLQTLTTWKESQATILDRREDVQSGKNEWRNGRRADSGPTRTPEFALKYPVGDGEVISTGFQTGPAVHIGGKILDKDQLDKWVRGKTIPCWYDPSDPGLVVVQRGFGAKYFLLGVLLGVMPLLMLWFGFRQLRKANRAVRQLDELESTVV